MSKHSLISLRHIPFKNKNRITDRYCCFSVFLKCVDTAASTRDQNESDPAEMLTVAVYENVLHDNV